MEKGFLIIITGPSGVGKGSIKLLISADRSLNLEPVVSYTTRKLRKFEVEGKDYNFISQDDFDKLKAEGQLIEYNDYKSYSYGTPKNKVENILSEGKNAILEVDSNSASQILEKYDGTRTISFVILPRSLDDLKHRLSKHEHDDDETISSKIVTVAKKSIDLNQYDYIVSNKNLQATADEIKTTILKIIQNGGKKEDQPKAQKIVLGI